jgi:hypothetical protein
MLHKYDSKQVYGWVYRFKGQSTHIKQPNSSQSLTELLKYGTSTPGMALELLPSIALSSTQAKIQYTTKINALISVDTYETADKMSQEAEVS